MKSLHSGESLLPGPFGDAGDSLQALLGSLRSVAQSVRGVAVSALREVLGLDLLVVTLVLLEEDILSAEFLVIL